MAEQWIEAAKALEVVNDSDAICKRLHAGLIKARAVKLQLGEDVKHHAIVPREFWWAEGNLALDQDWQSGDFSTWIDHKYHCRAFGVTFELSGLLEMMPSERRSMLTSALSVASSTEWMRAGEARDYLLRRLIPSPAKVICARAADGLIKARAKRYFINDSVRDDCEVEAFFWSECRNDYHLQSWEVGDFSLTIGRNDFRLYDVQFWRADIEQVAPEVRRIPLPAVEIELQPSQSAIPPTLTSHSGAASTKRLSDVWPHWVAELVWHIHCNGFPPGVGSQGQGEIIKAVANALAERGIEELGRSTVQSTVQAVLDRIRAADV